MRSPHHALDRDPMLDKALTGSAEPPTTAATVAAAMSNKASRCNGRLRLGSVVAATAMVTASWVTG
jgi:hypothetical protein